MKKKIFITGAVREYDSADPQKLADEIKQYLIDHLIQPECADAVNVFVSEPMEKTVRIRYLFFLGNETQKDCITKEMYRCFTGEHNGFHAENSCWWGLNFGPNYPMNILYGTEDIIDAHKKNTRFYKSNRYKSITLTESEYGLEVDINF